MRIGRVLRAEWIAGLGLPAVRDILNREFHAGFKIAHATGDVWLREAVVVGLLGLDMASPPRPPIGGRRRRAYAFYPDATFTICHSDLRPGKGARTEGRTDR